MLGHLWGNLYNIGPNKFIGGRGVVGEGVFLGEYWRKGALKCQAVGLKL